ncbi:MAG TPA: DUF2778 domain-containing protein [Xanthobacteraceae bacterium]|nr:DUF2778 domain-containing protein [Xanthobacteraceae bacterium]
MAYATAALPNVGAYGVGVVALGNCRRLAGGLAVGFGTISAAGAMAGSVTGLAAWMLAASLTGHPGLNARPSIALDTMALTGPSRRLAGVADLSSLAWLAIRSPHAPDSSPVAAPTVAALAAPAATSDGQVDLPASQQPAAETAGIPLPPVRPLPATPAAASESAPPAAVSTSKPGLASTAPSAPLSSFSLFQKTLLSAPSALQALVPRLSPHAAAVNAIRPDEPDAGAVAASHDGEDDSRLTTASLPPQQNRDKSIALASRDSHTAIYDIEAHTVYLPDGERLEAHSGLGYRLDDPRYVRDKARGPTPPNVYELALREQLFHGVRAIRLNPVDDGKMFGRDGMLAHTYMLGASGQSFGCVSFRDYQKFLQAFLRGDIDRLVVVPHLQDQPLGTVRTSRERASARTYYD